MQRSISRTYVIPATDAPVAVVLRRGPSKYVQLLRWNLTDDTLEPGQWFHGRIYEFNCDLSPSGKYLVYYATKQHLPTSELTSWTAVSRPPYLTALALWPSLGVCGGGGLFESDGKLQHNYPWDMNQLHDGFSVPANFVVSAFMRKNSEVMPDSLHEAILTRRGWTFEGALARKGDLLAHPSGEYFADLPGVGAVDWVDRDRNGDLLVSQDGKLFRSGKLVADLTANRFTEVAPPDWATRWD